MLVITYTLKRKRIKVAKWGTPKKILKKKEKNKCKIDSDFISLA
jgi:hypothetical protein